MTRRLSARTLSTRSTRAAEIRQRVRSDTGAATAEYAIVSVAAAGLGGILIKLLTSDWMMEIVKRILELILKVVLGLFGITL